MPKKKKATSLPWDFPLSLRDSASFLDRPIVALAGNEDTLFGLFYSFAHAHIDEIWLPAEKVGIGKQYAPINLGIMNPVQATQTHLQWLTNAALEKGATPEAIRLFQEHCSISANEAKKMAEAKLKSKSSKAAASDDAKPVGNGGAVGKATGKAKGNSEALAKAREARAANAGAPDVRKIKVLNKENPYRAESNRAASFDALKGAKTVADYVAAGGKTKYLSRWAAEGRIELA